MRHKFIEYVVVAALLIAAPAVAQPVDGIDLRAAIFHGENVADWPITVPVTGVEFAPANDRGVRLIFDRSTMNPRWPDVLNWPPAGYLQWTLYACVPVPEWHCGGMHEFWSDRHGAPREWSGAHPLNPTEDGKKDNWRGNWAYDGRWGAMSGYVPRQGDEIVFIAVAGALRPGTSNHVTVRERSNAIKVRLMPSGTQLVFTAPIPPAQPEPQPPQQPEPQPQPQQPPASGLSDEQYAAIMARFDKLDQEIDDARKDVQRGVSEALRDLPAMIRKAILGR